MIRTLILCVSFSGWAQHRHRAILAEVAAAPVVAVAGQSDRVAVLRPHLAPTVTVEERVAGRTPTVKQLAAAPLAETLARGALVVSPDIACRADCCDLRPLAPRARALTSACFTGDRISRVVIVSQPGDA